MASNYGSGETAIENAPAYQSLGLDQIFQCFAQEAAPVEDAASGAATCALGGVQLVFFRFWVVSLRHIGALLLEHL